MRISGTTYPGYNQSQGLNLALNQTTRTIQTVMNTPN